MSVTDIEPEIAPNGAGPEVSTPGPSDPAANGWRKDKQGRWFTPARGRSGVVYRQGNETTDEAHARDAKGPKDKRPKSKPKAPKPPAPTQTSLKELEFMLAEGLKSPAMICAAFGDEWPAEHFTTHGPVLARNLVKASEHNPWLRAKLEAAMTGEDFMVKFITAAGVAGALFLYAIPPVIYYVDPKFISPAAREMLGGIPTRRPPEAPDAPPAPPAAAPAPAGPPASA